MPTPQIARKPHPLDHIRQLLPAFQLDTVKQRIYEHTRGGHRPASFNEGRGNGDTPDIVAIRQLPRAQPWQPGDTPDPIIGQSDPTDRDLNQLERNLQRHLNAAELSLIAALNTQDRILAVAKYRDDDQPVDDTTWCRSCMRHTLPDGRTYFAPRSDPRKAGKDCVLCRWCDDWQRANEDWPPIELIALRAQGRRVDTRALLGLGLLQLHEIITAGSKNRVVQLAAGWPTGRTTPDKQ